MLEEHWSARQITDSAQEILKQIPLRAGARGLYVVDSVSIILLALWSLLLWERKVGRVALERMGVDPFELARDLDRLLTEKAREHPVVYDQRREIPVFAKTGEPYQDWDFHALVEPLLQQAEHEAIEVGHEYIGSEHLMLAIVNLADPSLLAVFQQHGVGHERVKEAVLQIYQG